VQMKMSDERLRVKAREGDVLEDKVTTGSGFGAGNKVGA
jgi:hypothetical protein